MALLHEDGRLRDRNKFSVALQRGMVDSPAGGDFCLLISNGNGEEASDGQFVSHLGRARNTGNVTSFEFRVSVSSVVRIDDPISTSEIISLISTPRRAKALEVLARRVNRKVPQATGAAIRDALIRVRPEIVSYVESLEDGPILRNDQQATRWREDRDAIRLSLRMSGIDDRPHTRLWRQPGDDQPYLAGLLSTSPEASLIDHDANRLPGWAAVPQYEAHLRTFTDGHSSVEIMNVNATGVEAVTGSDLIYYGKDTRSLVFVQYKKLDRDGRYRPDKQFQDQLRRLGAVQALGAMEPTVPAWRLGAHSAWIKLATAGPFDSEADDMIKGQYVPLDYVKLLLEDDCTLGERGGRVLGYRNITRYFNNTSFIELVSHGWVGTSGVKLTDIQDLGKQQADAGRSVVVAISDSDQPSPRARL